ncbi:MAG: UDP-3-O-(3-hydroxymyristoyl)glucosamine N-acyltransferase [Saprospiraceae bacterium]|nr:UDP-3-O-(3-hydroxymyristoyl)glucosamine N-acyltransferase [Saprospiraceae bacterium]
MQVSAQQLAQILSGSVEGNPEVMINRPSKIEEGGEGSISFLANPKYEQYAYTTTASALLVQTDFQPKQDLPKGLTLIRVADVYASIAFLLEKFGEQQAAAREDMSATITKTATGAAIHESAKVSEGVSVGPYSVIEAGASIGEGSRIYAQVYIGAKAKVGKNVTLYPGVRIMHECVIGDNCVLHPNVVIGGDGFGFSPQEDGSYKKVPQIGHVIIEDDVEIGANTTIDRATMGATIIRKGAKLDNLIQVAHNCEVGQNTVLASQVGIAGSTKIGANCQIGGQVGFSGHITIADGTKIQAQSGVPSSIKEPNKAFFGSPIMDYKAFIRSFGVFKKLPELYKKVYQIEKQIQDK